MDIFDSHSHIGKFGTINYKGNFSIPFKTFEIADLEDQSQFMKHNNIKYSVVVPHYTQDQKKPFNEFNRLVEELVEKTENILGGLWVSPLPALTKLNDNVLNSLPKNNIVALKISPSSWPDKLTLNPQSWDKSFKHNMEKIINALIINGLVLHVHTGSGKADAFHLDNFVKQYGQNLKIQFVHMGGSMSGHLSFIPRFIKWINTGYNFYTDISNSRGFAIKWILELSKNSPKLLKRILFASDNPWGDLDSELIKIQKLNCSDDIKNNILFKNAYDLYIAG
ncbi:hypothetical protein A2313_03805 [Candidatus Roizmanbacteria bacterium RIFOXYB2_FULL_41_10]|nr:MAG: hypothetical protein A2262_04605 [Candidatus Roizmanbacteria bacterium RIFOXYA2_FULL_41_8]OGK69235.1 MAG: hypothetical protein A2313_03805 [Candidatus Roizmanbacteria bacterium RIFOXYB2_FULL_41_10]OGK72980.1 MAG: hypothetical protein A2459_00810 [Candidatus Roizmanbacteria bacterium RIFOXYC2_FULL_41_10]OGZ28248.1 MAG: hypothetical protein A2562_00225 [Candidatus Nealsonbacteria bacterium RIFOXYD1_FULL_39_11]